MLITEKSSNFPKVWENKRVEVVLSEPKSLVKGLCRVGNQTAKQGCHVAVSGAWRNGPPGLGFRPLRGSTTQLMNARTQALLGWKEAGHWDKPLLSGKSVCSDSDSRDRRHKKEQLLFHFSRL